MKIRMIYYHPYACLEAETTDKNGTVFYTNLCLPEDGIKIKTIYDDDYYSYLKPLYEVNVDNCDEYYSGNEAREVAIKLADIWNSNPYFENTNWYEFKDDD